GKSVVVVAEMKGKLFIRVFDENANCLMTENEDSIDKEKEFKDLKEVLAPYWAGKQLTKEEERAVLDQIGILIKHPLRTWEEDRVRVSIERLKLNDHDALPAERRRVWNEVKTTIELYLAAKSKFRPGINPAPAGT